MAKIGVIRFPGSNCDLDVLHVLRNVLGVEADLLWHKTADLRRYDAAVLPGGFSYGDCLRAGIIAAHSPAMKQVKEMAEEGRPILGICNGFQILVEAGLLPGALLRNERLKFVCRWIACSVDSTRTPFTHLCEKGSVIRMPVAHNEGRFFVEEEDYGELLKHDQVVFRYCSQDEDRTIEVNPNGSLGSIAGLCNKEGNVLGLMPHPERASEAILDPGKEASGLRIFQSMMKAVS